MIAFKLVPYDSSSRYLCYLNLVNAAIVDMKFFNLLKVMWLYGHDVTSVKLASGVVILQGELLMDNYNDNC